MIIEKLEALYRVAADNAAIEKRSPFRASSAGHCTRKLAYQKLGLSGEPIQPRRWAVLKHGTFTHNALTADLCAAMGANYLDPESLGDCHVEIDGQKITFHPDGAFQGEQSEIGIVEIKTMSDYAFRRACDGEIDREYLCQAWVYAHGTSFNPIVFIAYRKETSAMVEIVFDRDATEKVVTQRFGGDPLAVSFEDPLMVTEIRSPFDPTVEAEVRARFAAVRDATLDHLPDGVWKTTPELVKVQGVKKADELRPTYGGPVQQSGSWFSFATGRTVLNFPCSYCEYKAHCYAGVRMEIIGGKPVHVVPGAPTPEAA